MVLAVVVVAACATVCSGNSKKSSCFVKTQKCCYRYQKCGYAIKKKYVYEACKIQQCVRKCYPNCSAVQKRNCRKLPTKECKRIPVKVCMYKKVCASYFGKRYTKCKRKRSKRCATKSKKVCVVRDKKKCVVVIRKVCVKKCKKFCKAVRGKKTVTKIIKYQKYCSKLYCDRPKIKGRAKEPKGYMSTKGQSVSKSGSCKVKK